MENQRPNIYEIATKELSQDAFFTWLLQWADESNKKYNQALHEIAQDFVRLLLGKKPDYEIKKVEAVRQWKKIDIKAEINDEYIIIIEDKKDAREHGNQLERYQIKTNEYCEDKNQLEPKLIYLKTGNENNDTLKKIGKNGYSIVDRKAVLDILKSRKIKNDILNDYLNYLHTIENQTNSYQNIKNITSWDPSDGRAAQGFYMQIEEYLKTRNHKNDFGWHSVSNRRGGFLCFWYHLTDLKDYQLKIQLENDFKDDIKVVVKIEEWNKDLKLLKGISSEIEKLGKKHGLDIVKPPKFRIGKTSTVAVVENIIPEETNWPDYFEHFMKNLKELEKTLDEYARKETKK